MFCFKLCAILHVFFSNSLVDTEHIWAVAKLAFYGRVYTSPGGSKDQCLGQKVEVPGGQPWSSKS